MSFKKTKLLIIIILSVLVLLPTNSILAADKKPIGAACSTNSDCQQGDCEYSNKLSPSTGEKLSYCDCAADSDCDDAYGKPTTGAWDCSDGAEYTYDMDYCYNTTTKEVRTSIGIDSTVRPTDKLVDAIFDSPVSKAALMEEVKTFQPKTEIRIPGLTFSDLGKNVDSEGYLHIPWIGELLKAIYNFGLGLISIVAVIMIILQGTRIIASGGEGKVEAYKKIGHIAVGLVIAWGSFAILYTINPALVKFNSLKIKYIEKIPIDPGNEASELVLNQQSEGMECFYEEFGDSATNVAAELTPVSFLNYTYKVHKKMAPALQKAASEAAALNTGYVIKSNDGAGAFSWRKNVNNPLQQSLHSFGIAFDINPTNNPNYHRTTPCSQNTNCTSCKTDIPKEIIAVLIRNGFRWGGNYRTVCDTMHFEWLGPCTKGTGWRSNSDTTSQTQQKEIGCCILDGISEEMSGQMCEEKYQALQEEDVTKVIIKSWISSSCQ